MGGGLLASVLLVVVPFAAFMFVLPGYGVGKVGAGSTVPGTSLRASPNVLPGGPAQSDSISAQDFVINEVLYDPAGPDDGFEFVELYNPTDVSLSLKGMCLETGNGAKAADWTLAVQWDSDFFVEPHGYLLIGEEAVRPTPQFVKQLDLQNGPDGCRIRRTSQVVDVVGWGPQTYPEYYEGNPCDDVASGFSLGRMPDGLDTGDNSADFKSLSPPSPGRRNFCIVDAGLVPASMCTVPALPIPFEKTEISVEVTNFGALELAGGQCAIDFFAIADSTRRLVASTTARTTVPGQSETISVSFLPEGSACVKLEAVLTLAEDENAGNDTTSIRLRVGEGDVVINEIMYAPAAGEPEWIELFNRGAAPVDVCNWSIEDSSKKKVRFSPLSILIAPGEYLVIAQDRELFQQRYRQFSCRVIEPEGSWPSFNNFASGASIYVDVVCVRDSLGCITDYVAYEEDWSTRKSSSIERVSTSVSGREKANWSSSVAEDASTPCEKNSVSEAAGKSRAFEIGMSSRIVSPDGDGVDDKVVLSFALPSQGMRANLTLFDADGRTVKRFLDQRKVGTIVQTVWDGLDEEGRPVPPGVYIVNLGVMKTDGGWEESRTTLVVAPKGMR